MTMWVVTRDFCDAKDRGYIYKAGDEYPRPGYEPEQLRVSELSSTSNRVGESLIKVKPQDIPKRGRRRKESHDDGNLPVSEELV